MIYFTSIQVLITLTFYNKKGYETFTQKLNKVSISKDNLNEIIIISRKLAKKISPDSRFVRVSALLSYTLDNKATTTDNIIDLNE